LLSTTDHSRDRGQILVLFAMSITVLLIVAALAFDVGMMLVERRDQQDAADAAALAGARYLTDAGRAEAVASAMAATNGFADDAATDVTVYIPPEHGVYRHMPGFIEVQIAASRPSIFGGIIGKASWPVGTYAVAANQKGLTFEFGMLALNETACKAIHVSGDGLVHVKSSIQSNSSGSDCLPGQPYGLSRTGGGTITVDATDGVCRTVGAIQDQGNGDMTCDPVDYSFALPDPLEGLPAVPKPLLAAPIERVAHSYDIPNYCPGSTDTGRQPSEDNPQTCVIGLGQAGDKQWILSPGLYPGGLDVKGNSTIYLLPGIYWIGGGGLQVAGDSDVYSVASALDLTTGKGGVLIYNSQLLPEAAAGPVSLGGSGANVDLQPLDPATGSAEAIYKDILLFQDRTVTTTVTLNGSASVANVRGIVYVPEGEVKLNGNGGTLTVDQVIADTFLADGNGGTIHVLEDRAVDVIISGVGLVE